MGVLIKRVMGVVLNIGGFLVKEVEVGKASPLRHASASLLIPITCADRMAWTNRDMIREGGLKFRMAKRYPEEVSQAEGA